MLHLTKLDTDKLLQSAGHPTLVKLKENSERHGSDLSIPLTGRSTELQKLQNALQATVQGQAHWVSIRGEAGIGKTRLAEELVTWARKRTFLSPERVLINQMGRWLIQPLPSCCANTTR